MHSAPRSLRAFINGPRGRVWICSSPVKVVVWPGGVRAAEPAAMRKVVPELPTSMISLGAAGFAPVPVIFQQFGSAASI